MVRYRYFLCLLPSDRARRDMDQLRMDQGWTRQIVESHRLHMTLVMLTMTDLPWRNCAAQLATAFEGQTLPACTIRLERFRGGMLTARERLSAVHRLRDMIVALLQGHGLPCDHIPERLHVTLSYAAGKPGLAMPPIEWRADRLSLIESHHGRHRHIPLRDWPLDEQSGFPPPPLQLDLWPERLRDRAPHGPPTNAPRSTSSSTSPSSSPSQ